MITNTKKEKINLLDGLPSSILAQESRGQVELVNSEMLPVRISSDEKAILESAGVKFGKPLKDNPLFCKAELPNGWKKERTDHSMWSKLIDEKGRERAMIFYKAAFYDRDAFMNVSKIE